MDNSSSLSVVILGATRAVGGQALLHMSAIERLSLLGRRPVANLTDSKVQQHKIDIFTPSTYHTLLAGHQVAICTLGVGQPSKMGKEDFIKIDKLAVIDFAKACKAAGIRHFELLASVGIDTKSSNFYLRTKGELVEALEAMHFERLSIFKPSMTLTPNNRYGFSQAVALKLFPLLKPILLGSLRKYRGIPVEVLGRAMAINTQLDKAGTEMLYWDDCYDLSNALSKAS